VDNRRKAKDRRVNNLKQDEAHKCNRRLRPCRRLASISAGWIPMGAIKQHPVIGQIFRELGFAL
jgi:hypothetical protein